MLVAQLRLFLIIISILYPEIHLILGFTSLELFSGPMIFFFQLGFPQKCINSLCFYSIDIINYFKMVCLEPKHSNTFDVVVVVQLPSHIWLFATPWTAAHQASPSLTISWSFPKSMFIASVMRPAILFSGALFSFHPQSFPASGNFPMSQPFASDDQNTGVSASASVLPMSIQGWCPIKLTGLISLLSKGLHSGNEK